jgi:predicted exporter
MKASPSALLLLAAWIVALIALAVIAERRLAVDSDLRLFLPAPSTDEQRLLLDAIGEGPAARLLIVELSRADAPTLADASRALADALRNDERFRFVANGDETLEGLPDALLAYRYLLHPDPTTRTFDREWLRMALEARARDLASPGGFALEPLIPRDPTFVLAALLDRWQPAHEPPRELGVWFDAARERALLLAETRAPAFDPDRQRDALDALQRAFAATGVANAVTLSTSGTGGFSVLMEARTRATAENLTRLAAIGMLAVLLVAYRRPSVLIVSALPLATAAVAGLAAVSIVFGAVHGITLAFGFTLLGVAQDYPLHLLSHGRPSAEPRMVARAIWPTLATGVASTCIAYLTFWLSGAAGLAQLACFTVVGLAAAALTTRYVLPGLLAPGARDYGDSRALRRIARAIAELPRPRFAPLVLALACVGATIAAPRPFWDNDLSTLTPVPEELVAHDRELRETLSLADVRHQLAVVAPTADAALERVEALDAELARLVATGAIASYDHAARYLPSAAVQRARQAELPSTDVLSAELAAALADSPFRRDAFAPFVADVERARTLPPLTPAVARAVPAVGARLDTLLLERDGAFTAVVALGGVSDVAPLRSLAGRTTGVTVLDVRAAAESLVAEQRSRMLLCLAFGALLLVAVVGFALRDSRRVYRVLAPLALTTLVVVAALQLAGVSLNLFHLISLILAAGLGLDYALFFEHSAEDPAEQARTLHAVLVCAASTLLVFVLLATADLPVLRAIGTPVALGVVVNFALALLITRGTTVTRRAAP